MWLCVCWYCVCVCVCGCVADKLCVCECVCVWKETMPIFGMLQLYCHIWKDTMPIFRTDILKESMPLFGVMRLHCHIWRCDAHIWKYTMPIFVKIQCHIGTGATALPYLDRHDAIFGKMVQQCHCPRPRLRHPPLLVLFVSPGCARPAQLGKIRRPLFGPIY